MLNASLLSIIEEACIAVLTLIEGLEEKEFLGSRLTRAEVGRQVKVITDMVTKIPDQTCEVMAEVDWAGWIAMGRQLQEPGQAANDALWFAAQSMIPATVMWLRVYRQNQPELFEYTSA